MTTAARPTWSARKSQSKGFQNDLTSLSTLVSAKDLPSHKQMKYRDSEKQDENEYGSKMGFMNIFLEKRESKSEQSKEILSIPKKALKLDQEIIIKSEASVDKSEDIGEAAEYDSSQVDDYESDDDELLAAELDRIKKERKEQEEQEILQQEKRSERIRKEQIVHGNPLLDSGSLGEKFNDDNSENTFEVKREWNHDVVFMNCSRRQDISGSKKEFINDPLRSEFHSNFMKKYIK